MSHVTCQVCHISVFDPRSQLHARTRRWRAVLHITKDISGCLNHEQGHYVLENMNDEIWLQQWIAGLPRLTIGLIRTIERIRQKFISRMLRVVEQLREWEYRSATEFWIAVLVAAKASMTIWFSDWTRRRKAAAVIMNMFSNWILDRCARRRSADTNGAEFERLPVRAAQESSRRYSAAAAQECNGQAWSDLKKRVKRMNY